MTATRPTIIKTHLPTPRSPHSFSPTTQALFYLISFHLIIKGTYYPLFILSSPLQGWRSNSTTFQRLAILRSQTAQSLQLTPASQNSAFLHDFDAIAYERTGGLYRYPYTVRAVNSQLVTHFYRTASQHQAVFIAKDNPILIAIA